VVVGGFAESYFHAFTGFEHVKAEVFSHVVFLSGGVCFLGGLIHGEFAILFRHRDKERALLVPEHYKEWFIHGWWVVWRRIKR